MEYNYLHRSKSNLYSPYVKLNIGIKHGCTSHGNFDKQSPYTNELLHI